MREGKGLSLLDVLRLNRKVESPEEGSTQPGSSATELGKGGCYLRLRALGLCRSSGCVSAVVLIPLPISARGLTPPPSAHWPAPHPPAGSVLWGGGGLSPPSARGLAAQQRRRLSRRTELAARSGAGESRRGAPGSHPRR